MWTPAVECLCPTYILETTQYGWALWPMLGTDTVSVSSKISPKALSSVIPMGIDATPCFRLVHNNLMYTMYILYFHAAFTCWLGLGVCWILVPICIQNNCFLFCVGEIRSHNFSDQFTLQIKPFVRVRRLADKKGDNWMNLLIKRECFLFILTLDKLERKILFI